MGIEPYPNPFNSELELVSALISTAAFVLLFILTTMHFRRKKTTTLLYLCLIVTAFLALFSMRSMSLVGWAVEHDHKNDVYRFGLALSYCFLQAANLCLLVFSDRIFNQLSSRRVGTWVIRFFAVFSIVLIALLLDIPGNNYGEYDGTTDLPVRRVVTQGAILASSAVLFLYMLLRFAMLATKTQVAKEKKLVRFVAVSYLCQLLSLLFVLIDGILNAPAPTIFIVFMHGSSVLAALFLYLGLLAPGS